MPPVRGGVSSLLPWLHRPSHLYPVNMEFRADSISWLPDALRSGTGETLLVIALIAVVVLVIDQIGRRYVLRLIHNILKRSPMKWDDLLVEHKVLLRAFPIIPLVVLQVAAPERVNLFPTHRRRFLCNNLGQLDADRCW